MALEALREEGLLVMGVELRVALEEEGRVEEMALSKAACCLLLSPAQPLSASPPIQPLPASPSLPSSPSFQILTAMILEERERARELASREREMGREGASKWRKGKGKGKGGSELRQGKGKGNTREGASRVSE